MQRGDLVLTTLAGIGKPSRSVYGLLIKPIATSFWSVFLFEEETFICLPFAAFEVISASR